MKEEYVRILYSNRSYRVRFYITTVALSRRSLKINDILALTLLDGFVVVVVAQNESGFFFSRSSMSFFYAQKKEKRRMRRKQISLSRDKSSNTGTSHPGLENKSQGPTPPNTAFLSPITSSVLTNQ